VKKKATRLAMVMHYKIKPFHWRHEWT